MWVVVVNISDMFSDPLCSLWCDGVFDYFVLHFVASYITSMTARTSQRGRASYPVAWRKVGDGHLASCRIVPRCRAPPEVLTDRARSTVETGPWVPPAAPAEKRRTRWSRMEQKERTRSVTRFHAMSCLLQHTIG